MEQQQHTANNIGQFPELFIPDSDLKGRPGIQEMVREIFEAPQIESQSFQQYESLQLKNRIQVKDPQSYPYSAIVYIQNFFSSKNSPIQGTGGLIGPNLVLTVAHNIRLTLLQREKQINDDNKRIQYNKKQAYCYFGVNGSLKSAIKMLKVKNMYYPKQYQTEKDQNVTKMLDYAILQLQTNEDLTKQYGYFGIRSNWDRLEQEIGLYGYPYDLMIQKIKNQSLSEEKKPYGFLFGFSGHIQNFLDSKTFMQYDQIGTSQGQSGSPIFIRLEKDCCAIVGLHSNSNKGIRLTTSICNGINELLKFYYSKQQYINWRIYEWSQQKKLNTILTLIEKKKNQLHLDHYIFKNVDLAYVGYFKFLTTLELGQNYIADIQNLKYLTLLTTLNLGINQIANISSIQKMTKLTTLSLGCNQISDISCIQTLTSITTLHLGQNPIKNIQSLKNIKSLLNLNLGQIETKDIRSICSIQLLTTLDLGTNRISEIAGLQKLNPHLTKLILGWNNITQIQCIGKITSLNYLDLGINTIKDISNLINLNSLVTLNLRSNDINVGIYRQKNTKTIKDLRLKGTIVCYCSDD